MRGRLQLFLILAAAAAGIAVLYAFDPSESVFYPRCPFFWVTGLKCPGCGSLRAAHQLLHLHFGEAMRYNALMVLFIPLLLFMSLADLFKAKYPEPYLLARNPVLSWAILAAILLWWLFRNVFGL